MAEAVDESVAVSATCDGCRFLAADRCGLREVAIARPAATTCASHPVHGMLRRAFAIGPVVELGAGTDRDATLLHPAPDSAAIRNRLIDLVADLQPHGSEPLPLRAAIAVQHLQQLDEPRAYVHLDRIEASQIIHRARRGARERSALAMFGRMLEHHAPAVSPEPTEFLNRFTLRGRLLLQSSLVVGAIAGAAFLGLEAMWTAQSSDGWVLHIGYAVGVGILAAAGWLRLGLAVFARRGIAFRAGADDPGDRAEYGADPGPRR